MAKEWPSIKAKAIGEAGIRALKMGAFLAVTQGSEQPPRLIVCEYLSLIHISDSRFEYTK